MSTLAPAMTPSIGIGSSEHRQLLAEFFLQTHIEFAPESITWPQLDAASLERLTRLPFWQEAVSTEAETSRTVTAAAALEDDPQLRRAIALQGLEEQRHAQLLRAMTGHFGIRVTVPPAPPSTSLEDDFLFAGFGECFDSFFAFGLYRVAQQSGYFAPELVRIFEPIIQEEARHILFFVNWVRYRRARLSWWRRPLFRMRCAAIILRHIASRVRTARTMSAQPAAPDAMPDAAPLAPANATAAAPTSAAAPGDGENFTLSAHRDLGGSMTLRGLLGLCLRENELRLRRYDARLLRPRLVPRLARCAHWLLGLWPERAAATPAS